MSSENPKHALLRNTVERISDFLEIPNTPVFIKPKDTFKDPRLSSTFDLNDYSVHFNEDWLNEADDLKIIAQAFHETRHIYQKVCLDLDLYEPEDILESWRDNFNHYVHPDLTQKDGGLDHLTQPLELDAMAFTAEAMEHYHQFKIYIPESIEIHVFSRMRDIELPELY